MLNEIAKNIQEGKSADALAALKRLEEVHAKELSEAETRRGLVSLNIFVGLFSSPWKVVALVNIHLRIRFSRLPLPRNVSKAQPLTTN